MIFYKIFYINLDRRSDRNAYIIKLLKNHNSRKYLQQTDLKN